LVLNFYYSNKFPARCT